MKKSIIIILFFTFINILGKAQSSIAFSYDLGGNTRIIMNKGIADSTFKDVTKNELNGLNTNFGMHYFYKRKHTWHLGILYNQLNYYTNIVSYHSIYNPNGEPHLLGIKFRYREDNIVFPIRYNFLSIDRKKMNFNVDLGSDFLVNTIYMHYLIKVYDTNPIGPGWNSAWGKQNQRSNHFTISNQLAVGFNFTYKLSNNIQLGMYSISNYVFGKSISSKMNTQQQYLGIYQEEIKGNNLKTNFGLIVKIKNK